MQPKTIILMGRSGSGKGTQAKLLLEYFKERGESTIYLETGEHLRKFIKGERWSEVHAKEVINAGRFLPAFLAIRNWGNFFVEHYTGGEHMVIDGTPRTQIEAEALDGALGFYERTKLPKALVVVLEVPEDEIVRRLVPRGRADDTPEAIKSRLSEFDIKVKPILDYYEAHPEYKMIRMDGHRSIESIQAELRQLVV